MQRIVYKQQSLAANSERISLAIIHTTPSISRDDLDDAIRALEERLGGRFDQLETRIKETEQRLEQHLDKRIEEANQHLDQRLDKAVEEISAQLPTGVS